MMEKYMGSTNILIATSSIQCHEITKHSVNRIHLFSSVWQLTYTFTYFFFRLQNICNRLIVKCGTCAYVKQGRVFWVFQIQIKFFGSSGLLKAEIKCIKPSQPSSESGFLRRTKCNQSLKLKHKVLSQQSHSFYYNSLNDQRSVHQLHFQTYDFEMELYVFIIIIFENVLFL